MNKSAVAALTCLFVLHLNLSAQYNTLWIPDTLSGTTFNLTLKDSVKQILSGPMTLTEGINGSFWGPTLIWNKGDSLHIAVNNLLTDTTTIHWHGMHLPAVMDGGPHQPIPPLSSWHPYWKLDNDAATYWYHPHMHMMAEHQLDQGLGGFIIVRDSNEASLPLPRTYGLDDIPLALSDRRFNLLNQIEDVPYGDSMMVNGTIHAQYDVPAQIVRFRILNSNVERSYNLGFSDNRNFSVIASDGGLLNAPVAVTRYLLSAGERIEILVDFGGQQGQSLDLKAYNSTLTQSQPGGDVFPTGTPFYNLLARKDFNILHLNVQAATANPITTIPSTLANNTYYDESSANLTRNVSISDTNIAGVPGVAFVINHHVFDMEYVDYQVPLNNTEIWQITNTGNFSHPFHIHDVQFYILTRNGTAPPAAERGWKDVVFVKNAETVRFITQFKDFADSTHPYMFHCHIALHEDDGMMGQFVVVEPATSIGEISSENNLSLYPNPASDKIHYSSADDFQPERILIYNALGQFVLSAKPKATEIEVASLMPGIYNALFLDKKGNRKYGRIVKAIFDK